MVPAIVLAAGESARMGRSKALLAADASGTTFVRRLTATLWEAGCEEVIVVLGHDAERIAADLEQGDVPVRVLLNRGWTSGQLSSLIVGIDAVDRPGVQAAAVALVDAPLVSVETVKRLLRARAETKSPIVRPARPPRHGHPVIFDRRLFAELRRADPALGAKAVVRAHAAEILDVAVEDDGAFHDIDTPEDYARINQV